jgi:hypothetical protein
MNDDRCRDIPTLFTPTSRYDRKKSRYNEEFSTRYEKRQGEKERGERERE